MILEPSGDTLITMAKKVYEASNLKFLNVSFNIGLEKTYINVWRHDDIAGTKELFERVSVAQLVASYIGLTLVTDLDANDAVTTGHRLGNTGRKGGDV
jgi:hypothetical protein